MSITCSLSAELTPVIDASFVLHKTAHDPTESLMKVTTCTFGTHGAANFVRRFGASWPKKLDRDISSARTNRGARDHEPPCALTDRVSIRPSRRSEDVHQRLLRPTHPSMSGALGIAASTRRCRPLAAGRPRPPPAWNKSTCPGSSFGASREADMNPIPRITHGPARRQRNPASSDACN